MTWFSLFLLRSSANFAKKIQELTEEKAENPRTCRGQSRERNPYRRLQEKLNLKALFFSTPLPYRKLLFIAALQTPKTLGGGTPPRGASIRRPPGTACETAHQVSGFFFSSLSGFFFSKVLVPPPKSSPSRPGPTSSSAAICGAGASWRLLGRKSRVPRGFQKLLKF